MQAFVARAIQNDTVETFRKGGYFVDKVDVLEVIKTFDPDTNECTSTKWKVKFVDYDKLDYSYTDKVSAIHTSEEDCQKAVDALNAQLEVMRRDSNYSDEELETLKKYREEYQQLARESWDKDHTL